MKANSNRYLFRTCEYDMLNSYLQIFCQIIIVPIIGQCTAGNCLLYTRVQPLCCKY